MASRSATVERLLVPMLDDAVVFARGGDELLALPRYCASGLFDSRHPCPPGRPRSPSARASDSAWRSRSRRSICLRAASGYRCTSWAAWRSCASTSLVRLFRTVWSTSQSAAISTFGCAVKPLILSFPRPRNPMQPTRIRSFALAARKRLARAGGSGRSHHKMSSIHRPPFPALGRAGSNSISTFTRLISCETSTRNNRQ